MADFIPIMIIHATIVVKNHNILDVTIDAVLKAAQAFFELPADIKMKVRELNTNTCLLILHAKDL